MTTLVLGKTEVPRIGLGTNRLQDTADHAAFVRDAIAAGIRHIDTAHLYSRGGSESAIGAALEFGRPDDLVVATKGGYHDGRPEAIARDIDDSLRRLRTIWGLRTSLKSRRKESSATMGRPRARQGRRGAEARWPSVRRLAAAGGTGDGLTLARRPTVTLQGRCASSSPTCGGLARHQRRARSDLCPTRPPPRISTSERATIASQRSARRRIANVLIRKP
jgi:hypothetical protein